MRALASRGVPIACHVRQPTARVTLVCFHHAGGSALSFGRWGPALAPDVELWSVTLPGRATRVHEPFACDWESLVDEFATALDATIEGPLALFGHSLGATLAFEVTRELQRRGASPAHLFVSARGAPDATPHFTVPDDDEVLLREVGALYGGLPEALCGSRDVLDYFLPILRADIELAAAYSFSAGPRLQVPITALAGNADATLSRAQVEGWRRQTGAGFEYRELPGGHFYMEGQEPALFETIVTGLGE